MSRPSAAGGPTRTHADERAQDHAYAHRRLLRDLFTAEKRILPSWKARPRRIKPPPPAIPQARRAAAILKAVLERYEPGSRLSRSHIIAAAGCRESEAVWVRDWAKSQGRWPYADAAGMHGHAERRKAGGS
jgi:hypothetical protein